MKVQENSYKMNFHFQCNLLDHRTFHDAVPHQQLHILYVAIKIPLIKELSKYIKCYQDFFVCKML